MCFSTNFSIYYTESHFALSWLTSTRSRFTRLLWWTVVVLQRSSRVSAPSSTCPHVSLTYCLRASPGASSCKNTRPGGARDILVLFLVSIKGPFCFLKGRVCPSGSKRKEITKRKECLQCLFLRSAVHDERTVLAWGWWGLSRWTHSACPACPRHVRQVCTGTGRPTDGRGKMVLFMFNHS